MAQQGLCNRLAHFNRNSTPTVVARDEMTQPVLVGTSVAPFSIHTCNAIHAPLSSLLIAILGATNMLLHFKRLTRRIRNLPLTSTRSSALRQRPTSRCATLATGIHRCAHHPPACNRFSHWIVDVCARAFLSWGAVCNSRNPTLCS